MSDDATNSSVGVRLGAAIISALVIVGFISVIGLLLFRPINVNNEVGDVLKMLLGTLAAKFGDVVAFHINSSSGSKSKDDIIATRLVPMPSQPAPAQPAPPPPAQQPAPPVPGGADAMLNPPRPPRM